MTKKTVYIENYGCSNNLAEGQIMSALLKQAGFLMVEKEDMADVIIINTCAVKDKTENKIIDRLASFSKKYARKKIIVAGCLPETNIDRIRKTVPHASILSTNHLIDIVKTARSAVNDIRVEITGHASSEKLKLPKDSTGAVDIVPISSGCLSACVFCATKIAKGPLLSYKEENIIDEIICSQKSGCKEFWLTSQDCGCYGFDINTNAAKLLNNILHDVDGQYFIRFGMANPQHVRKYIQDLIDAYRDRRIFKFLHVPVQSGSNAVLKTMARGHTVEDFAFIVKEFRKNFPEITIWTDVIIGFPGESQEDFDLSLKLLKEIKPDVVNISAFSARPNASASKMKQISTQVKKERTRKMSRLAKSIFLEKNRHWLGWKGPVLVDEYRQKNRNFVARNYAYKPVVLKEKNLRLGQVVNVEIVNCSHTHLLGKIVKT